MTKIIFRIIKVVMALAVTIGIYTNAGASREIPGQRIVTAGSLGPITYYVSPTGSDSNSGSADLPFKTLAKGVSVLIPGDTLIASGTFHEQFNVSKSGTSTARITYFSNGAIIDNTTTNKGISITASYVNLIGFKVEHGIQHAISNTGQHNTIENNITHDSVTENGTDGNCGSKGSSGWSSAISIRPGSDDVTVRNNESYNNCGEGIDVQQSTNVLVEGNRVHDNFSVNIYVDNSHDVTVHNNIVTCRDFNLRDGHRAEGMADGAEFYSGWGDQRFNNYFIGNNVSGCQDAIDLWGSSVGGVTRNILIQGNIMPSGTRRSVSISSTNNQDVMVRDNQGFALPYIANSAGVTSLNNVIISTTPTITPLVPSPTQTTVVPSLMPTFTSTPVPTEPSLPLESTLASPTLTLQPPTPMATATLAASPTPVPFTSTPTATLLPTLTDTSIPATDIVTASSVPASPTATNPSVPVTVTPSQPGKMTIYDDKNSNFIYSSGWGNVSEQQAYQGSYKLTTKNGSWVTFNFTGQSFTVVFTGGPAYKKINVYMDGLLVGTINEKVDATKYQKNWTYPAQLTLGSHKLKLVFVTSSRSNTYGSIDAVIVR